METNDFKMEMKHRYIIPVMLEVENYGLWSRFVETALESCGLWSSHIKVEALEEMATEEGQTRCLEDEDKWVQEDNKTLEIIHGSLSESILEVYKQCRTAKELWETLEAAYENKSNLMRVYEVKKAISDLKQEEDEFNQHVGKLRCLWLELNVLRPSTSDPEVLQERLEQDVVFSLLVSLNSSYGQLISSILRKDKLPDVDGVCELVQREQGGHKRSEKNKNLSCTKNGTSYNQRRLRKLSVARRAKGTFWRKIRLSGGLGNILDMSLVEKDAQQIIKGKCSYSAYMGESLKGSMEMREQKIAGADDPITRKEWDTLIESIQAMVTTKKPGRHSSASKPIIIDSGASHHMIRDRSLLSDIKATTGSVMIANGDRIPIEGIGNLKLFEKDSAAFYLPRFTSNLISVKRATIDLDCQVVFRPNEVEFQDLKSGQVIGRGDSRNELYHLQTTMLSKPFDSGCLNSATDRIDSIIWHARLGHPHTHAIELILPAFSFNHLECEACILWM